MNSFVDRLLGAQEAPIALRDEPPGLEVLDAAEVQSFNRALFQTSLSPWDNFLNELSAFERVLTTTVGEARAVSEDCLSSAERDAGEILNEARAEAELILRQAERSAQAVMYEASQRAYESLARSREQAALAEQAFTARIDQVVAHSMARLRAALEVRDPNETSTNGSVVHAAVAHLAENEALSNLSLAESGSGWQTVACSPVEDEPTERQRDPAAGNDHGFLMGVVDYQVIDTEVRFGIPGEFTFPGLLALRETLGQLSAVRHVQVRPKSEELVVVVLESANPEQTASELAELDGAAPQEGS